MMNLNEICKKVLEIEEGLMYGHISFSYDNLISALKPGHPADIIDEILAEIYFDVIGGKEIPIDRLKSVLEAFKEFKKVFKIKEMKTPIDELTKYIKNHVED